MQLFVNMEGFYTKSATVLDTYGVVDRRECSTVVTEVESFDCATSSGDSSHYGLCNDSLVDHVFKCATETPNLTVD